MIGIRQIKFNYYLFNTTSKLVEFTTVLTTIATTVVGHCDSSCSVWLQNGRLFVLIVPPLIRIQNQMVGVANGSTAVLECDVEAFPEPVHYWERADGRLLEAGHKYSIHSSIRDRYKVIKIITAIIIY